MLLKWAPGLFDGSGGSGSLFDRISRKTDLKDEEKTKKVEEAMTDSWKKKPEPVEPANVAEWKEKGPEEAATLYACHWIDGLSGVDDPNVLIKVLDDVKSGEDSGYKRVNSYAKFREQKEVKKGTVVFVSFKPMSRRLIPMVATGNGDEFVALCADPKDENDNPVKAERKFYIHSGEPKIPGGSFFQGALVPNFTTSLDYAGPVEESDKTAPGRLRATDHKLSKPLKELESKKVLADSLPKKEVKVQNFKLAVAELEKVVRVVKDGMTALLELEE